MFFWNCLVKKIKKSMMSTLVLSKRQPRTGRCQGQRQESSGRTDSGQCECASDPIWEALTQAGQIAAPMRRSGPRTLRVRGAGISISSPGHFCPFSLSSTSSLPATALKWQAVLQLSLLGDPGTSPGWDWGSPLNRESLHGQPFTV